MKTPFEIIKLAVNHGRHRSSDSFVAEMIIDALKKKGWDITSAPEAGWRTGMIDLVANLAAAISLLERSPKTAAPSDKMFDMMLADYRSALDRGRAFLNATAPPAPEKEGEQP